MFQKLTAALICAINVNCYPMNVFRDGKPFGCVIIARPEGIGGPPFPAVNGSASGDQCAQFEAACATVLTELGVGCLLYFNLNAYKEMSTGKYLSHSDGSDWIYLDGDSNTTPNTHFYVDYDSYNSGYTFRSPSAPGNFLYAETMVI